MNMLVPFALARTAINKAVCAGTSKSPDLIAVLVKDDDSDTFSQIASTFGALIARVPHHDTTD